MYIGAFASFYVSSHFKPFQLKAIVHSHPLVHALGPPPAASPGAPRGAGVKALISPMRRCANCDSRGTLKPTHLGKVVSSFF